jgi:hypothetical protein
MNETLYIVKSHLIGTTHTTLSWKLQNHLSVKLSHLYFLS